MDKKLSKLATDIAAKSPCNKRKVGAVIVDIKGNVLSTGYNYEPSGSKCECSDGSTKKSVIHAEVAALNNLSKADKAFEIYVTHEPCTNCSNAIAKAGIGRVTVVEDFLKFDNDKLRYELIPTEILAELAKVLTYGAKKYKPNNWKLVDDNSRYIGAVFRHLEAWRGGEKLDESGLHHLSHVLTNVAFLLYLDMKEK